MLRLFLSHSLDDIQCTFLVLEQQRLLKSNFTSNDSMDKLGLLLKINAHDSRWWRQHSIALVDKHAKDASIGFCFNNIIAYGIRCIWVDDAIKWIFDIFFSDWKTVDLFIHDLRICFLEQKIPKVYAIRNKIRRWINK